MNPCVTVTLTSFLVIVILLRIIFAMMEIGNLSLDDEPTTKQRLRGESLVILAYERYDQIHKRVWQIAVTGGHNYEYNLCYKDNDVNHIIYEMIKEAFPDSNAESSPNGTCTTYKMSW